MPGDGPVPPVAQHLHAEVEADIQLVARRRAGRAVLQPPLQAPPQQLPACAHRSARPAPRRARPSGRTRCHRPRSPAHRAAGSRSPKPQQPEADRPAAAGRRRHRLDDEIDDTARDMDALPDGLAGDGPLHILLRLRQREDRSLIRIRPAPRSCRATCREPAPPGSALSAFSSAGSGSSQGSSRHQLASRRAAAATTAPPPDAASSARPAGRSPPAPRASPHPSPSAVPGIADRIGEFVDAGDGDVEGEAVQRLGHRGDGPVRHLAQLAAPRPQRPRPRCRRAAGRAARRRPAGRSAG